jgi:hypothetical protein
MSSATQPIAPSVDNRPQELVVVSHSPLFYWWPVWAVGFMMAGLTYWNGYQVAFVPPGTVAQRGTRVEGFDGPRDVLIAPAGRALPVESESDELKQPRLLMVASNNPGIIWALTLCLVIVTSNVPLRGMWSLLTIMVVGFTTILLAILGLWDPILRAIQVIDIHITAFSYLSISRSCSSSGWSRSCCSTAWPTRSSRAANSVFEWRSVTGKRCTTPGGWWSRDIATTCSDTGCSASGRAT